MKFLDQAKIYIRSGDGGDGCVAFRRERYVAFGGPDGGNGGRGGDVIVECVSDLNTLIDFRYRQHFKGKRGNHGMGKNRNGRNGESVVVKVPVGTQILEEDRETLFADLTEPGQQTVLARGGAGGHGNTHYKSSTNQAPHRAQPGASGEDMWLWLRLKLIADEMARTPFRTCTITSFTRYSSNPFAYLISATPIDFRLLRLVELAFEALMICV